MHSCIAFWSACMPADMALLYLFLKVMKIPEMWIAFQKFQILSFMKNNNKHCLFNFSRDQPKRLCRNLLKSLVDALHLRERQKYADLLLEVLWACMKDMKLKKSLQSLLKRTPQSWIDLWNQGAICKKKSFVSAGKHCRVCLSCTCKTVSSGKEMFPNVKESIPWEVAFCHHWRERWLLRELWSLQYCCEMIGLADSWAWSANHFLSCVESVREVHSVGLPCDFLVKLGIWS